MRKWKILLFVLLMIMSVSYLVTQAKTKSESSSYTTPSYQMDANLVEEEDTRTVEQTIQVSDLEALGFELITTSTDLRLYLNRSILNIAIYDERSDYIWFGYYPDYQSKPYTNTLKRWIESGITVDYYDATSLNEARMSLSNPDAG